MAYGSTAGVVALVPRWASGGSFDGTTRPTATHVTSWLSEVSTMLDIKLSELGFTVPITDADVTPMLDLFTNTEVAVMADGVNGSGKFGPTGMKKDKRGSRWHLIMEDVNAFLDEVAVGLERSGAARTSSTTTGVGYRDTDEQGDDTFPLRQRREFHDWSSQTNWDD